MAAGVGLPGGAPSSVAQVGRIVPKARVVAVPPAAATRRPGPAGVVVAVPPTAATRRPGLAGVVLTVTIHADGVVVAARPRRLGAPLHRAVRWTRPGVGAVVAATPKRQADRGLMVLNIVLPVQIRVHRQW